MRATTFSLQHSFYHPVSPTSTHHVGGSVERLVYDRPMIPEDRERRPSATEHVVSQEAENQAVLLQLEIGKYFSLDAVGSRIWRLCDGRRTVREIAIEIAREFDADLPTIEHDVDELLTQLEREQLVRFD